MTLNIRVACDPGQAHVAVVRDDTLIDYALWRRGSPDGVGDIHRGRVVSVVPSMAGAFVALHATEGFLPDSAGAKGLGVGSMVKVKVTRAALGGKGPRLTALGPDAGDTVLLERGPDPVTRFAAQHPAAPVLVDDAGIAAILRATLGDRVAATSDVLTEPVAAAIDTLAASEVALHGGARIAIWPTPALTAIDVDAGSLLARERHGRINRMVLPLLAAQIRLRDLSGAIVVDVAGLSVRQRATLAPEFTSVLADDPMQPKFLGFTALGLAEIIRRRVHPPLHEILSGSLATGLAGLKAMVAAFDGVTLPALRTNPAVVAALEQDVAGLDDVRRRTGHAVSLRPDPAQPAWILEYDHG